MPRRGDARAASSARTHFAIMCDTQRLLLYSAAGSLAYLVVLLVAARVRGAARQDGFVALLTAVLAVMGYAIVRRKECGVPGQLGLGLFALTIAFPGLLGAVERAAGERGHERLARACGRVRALLQPGSIVARERELRARARAQRAAGAGDLGAAGTGWPGWVRPRTTPRKGRVTMVLATVNVTLFVWGYVACRHPSGFTLVARGANFHPAVAAGELWRLAASMFLHADWLHIAGNTLGLVMIGRLVEALCGPRRLLAIYILAGVGGSAASALAPRAEISIGASGGVYGLLGALFVTLVRSRAHLPEAWRRRLLLNLVVIVGIELVVDYHVTMVDIAAHAGGLGTGALLALALGGAEAQIRTWTALALAVGAVGYGFLGLLRYDPDTLLVRLPHARTWHGGTSLLAPAYWQASPQGLYDPLTGLSTTVDVADLGPSYALSPAQLVRLLDELPEAVAGETGAWPVRAPDVAGWHGAGMTYLVADAESGGQVRVLDWLFVRAAAGGHATSLRVRIPEQDARPYVAFLPELLASVQSALTH
jgi:membrane associated rhomboid family serine protease